MSLSYLTTHNVYENVLITANNISTPQNYKLLTLGPGGTTVPVDPPVFKTNHDSGGSARILGMDRLESDVLPKRSFLHIRGCIVYSNAADIVSSSWDRVSFPNGESSVTVTDLVSVMDPANAKFNLGTMASIALNRGPQHGPNAPSPTNPDDPQCTNTSASYYPCYVRDNTAARITSIRAQAGQDVIHSDWTSAGLGGSVTGWSSGTSRFTVQTPWQNTSVSGARVCYQTSAGVVDTSKPLWPWPMNERIKAATSAAGNFWTNIEAKWPKASSTNNPCHATKAACSGTMGFTRVATDVTAELEALLGTIPELCKTSAIVIPPFDDAPANWPLMPELDAFGDSGMAGFTRTFGSVSWTEGGGVATAPGSFSTMRYDTQFSADQEAWVVISSPPAEGGVGLFLKFLIVGADDKNQYEVILSSVAGSNNDTISVRRRVNSTNTTIVDPFSLTVDIAANDRLGIRVLNDTLLVLYFSGTWGEWRTVATETLSDLPALSHIGFGASVGAITSFGGGSLTTRGFRPIAPSRPVAPSRPPAPGAQI
jgi:hypothetical protein